MRVRIERSDGLSWYRDKIGHTFEVRLTQKEDLCREDLTGLEYVVLQKDLTNHDMPRGNYFIADEDVFHKIKLHITIKDGKIEYTTHPAQR